MILICAFVGYNKKQITNKNTSVPFTCPGARQLCRVESLHHPRHPPTAVALIAIVNETAYTTTEQEAARAPDLVRTFCKKKKNIYIYIYLYIYNKVKIKFTLELGTKAQRGSRSIALLFL
jgi:hypothetical protein